LDLDIRQDIRELMLSEGVSYMEILAIIETHERVETSGSLVAYHGSLGGRHFG
jgi:hypothetical protein